MSDVFISYSAKDRKIANLLYGLCQHFKIDSFFAPISIKPGSMWKKEILENLSQAKWFFFLATKNSIKSDAIKHEIGGALTLKRHNIDESVY